MDKRHQPQYDKALEQPNRRKIVQAIAQEGGTAKFSTICKRTSIKDNTLLHHLNVLIEYGIIEQIADGPYALRYKTPLGFILNEKAPEKERCVYFGLLGDRRERDEPETTIALYQLAEAYLIPLIYIYEPRGKLKWLISKQSLSKRLGI